MDILDSLGMHDLTMGLPDQFRTAMEVSRSVDGLPGAGGVRDVVVLGMGGSAIAGSVLQAMALEFGSVPVHVQRGYRLPAHVGPDSLVFAVSYSGETEETLEAVASALDRGAAIVAVTSGGTLAGLASEAGAPVFPVPSGFQPRTQMAAMAVPLLDASERLGLLPGMSSGTGTQFDDALACMDALREKLGDDPTSTSDPTASVARRLDRRIPLVYGSDGAAEVAAYRWKCQVNENAKAPAFHNSLPELDHNELCGWGQHGDVTRQVLVLVELRHDLEHPQVSRRFEYTRELVEETVGDVVEVRSDATTLLGALFELAMFGDAVSLHLARLGDVDPGPVPALVDLKLRLAGS